MEVERIFAVVESLTYDNSVEFCAKENSILAPLKTREDFDLFCKKYEDITDLSGDGTFWRIGLYFYQNGTGIWSDGTLYNSLTDMKVDYGYLGIGGDSSFGYEVYIICSSKLYIKLTKSWNDINPFLCYTNSNRNIQYSQTIAASTPSPITTGFQINNIQSPTVGFPTQNIQSRTTVFPTQTIQSPTPEGFPSAYLIIAVVAFIIGLMLGYRFKKIRDRLNGRHRSDELKVEYKVANHQINLNLPVNDEDEQANEEVTNHEYSEVKDHVTIQPNDAGVSTNQTRQVIVDTNNDPDYITPNIASQEALESMGGRHVYSEIDQHPNDVRISVDPSQQQQDQGKEEDVDEADHSNHVYSEIQHQINPNTSSNDVVVTSDLQAVVGYVTMKGLKSAATSSDVTPHKK